MKILKNIPALQNFCDMLYTKSMGFNIKMLLTPSVHKTVMRCFSSCPFYTENRIAVFTKDGQLSLISFYLIYIIAIHCLMSF